MLIMVSQSDVIAETDYSSSTKSSSKASIIIVDNDEQAISQPDLGKEIGLGVGTVKDTQTLKSGSSKLNSLPQTGYSSSFIYSFIGAGIVLLLGVWKNGEEKIS